MVPSVRAPKLYSPYGPRAKRSNQLVVLWVGGFFTILFFIYYITTRHPDTARTYQDMLRKGPQQDSANPE